MTIKTVSREYVGVIFKKKTNQQFVLFLKLLSLLARSLIDVARVASRHKRPSLLHAAPRHPRMMRKSAEMTTHQLAPENWSESKKSQNTQKKNGEAHGKTRV